MKTTLVFVLGGAQELKIQVKEKKDRNLLSMFMTVTVIRETSRRRQKTLLIRTGLLSFDHFEQKEVA